MKQTLETLRKKGRSLLNPGRVDIAVGMGTCGIGNGADVLYEAFKQAIEKNKLAIQLRKVGCFGFCANEPLDIRTLSTFLINPCLCSTKSKSLRFR